MKLSFGMIAANFFIGMIAAVICFFTGLGLETLNEGNGSIIINIISVIIPLLIIFAANMFMIRSHRKKAKSEKEFNRKKFWTVHIISAVVGASVPIIVVICMLSGQ